MLLLSEKSISMTPIFGQQGGCSKTFFNNLCFLMWKVSVFCPFFAEFGLMFKKHCTNRYFSTFSKAKKENNDHAEGWLSGPSKGYYIGEVCCNIKLANLARIITLQFFACTAEPSILRRRILSKKTPANFPVFGDQILQGRGPNCPLCFSLQLPIVISSP